MKSYCSLGAKLNLFSVVIALMAFSASKKTVTRNPTSIATPHPKTTLATVDVKIDTDVYVAGYYVATNGNEVSAYWKNGVITKLSDSTLRSVPSGIAVAYPDIYVCGKYFGLGLNTPVYWKNDSTGITRLQFLGGSLSAITTGISVYNHSVYLSGKLFDVITKQHYPGYWRDNNQPFLLLQDYRSGNNSIIADETGVYNAGYVRPGTNHVFAAYWKATEAVHVVSDTLFASQAVAIALKGADIYMAGVTNKPNNSIATYWKNGIHVYLVDSLKDSYAAGIAIKNNFVYIAGYQTAANGHKVPCYWKDGVQTNLSDDTHNMEAKGIAVAGNDVYVSGYDAANGKAVYWKNGQLHTLPGGVTTAGIVVVTHPH